MHNKPAIDLIITGCAVSTVKETGRTEEVTQVGSFSWRRRGWDSEEETRRLRRCSHEEGRGNGQRSGGRDSECQRCQG